MKEKHSNVYVHVRIAIYLMYVECHRYLCACNNVFNERYYALGFCSKHNHKLMISESAALLVCI